MPDIYPDKEKTYFLDIFILAFIFLFFFFLNLPFAFRQFLSPDAALYLDVARNIAAGRGAVVSLNQYQFWQGVSYPLWPYTQPLYPLLASLPFKLGGVSAVIMLNIFLFAGNCCLIYLLVRRYAGVYGGLSAAVFIGFSYNVVYTAIFPWTEQIFLALVLLAFYLYSAADREKGWFTHVKCNFLVGVLLGLSCLARAAGIYAGIMFFVAVVCTGGMAKGKRFGFFLLLSGFLAVIGSYEIFCLVKYHIFYPAYLAPGVNYNNARRYPGAFYAAGKTFLHMSAHPVMFLRETAEFFHNLKNLLIFFSRALFLLAAPLVYFAAGAYGRSSVFVRLLFFYGVLNFLFCFIFMENMGLEWLRLLLIGFVAMAITALLLIVQEKSILRLVFIPAAFLCLIMSATDYFYFRADMLGNFTQELNAKRTAQAPFYSWVAEHTRSNDIVAVQFIDEAFWLDRPVVALPLGAMVNEKNIRDFIQIYQPRYILAQDPRIITFCRGLGFFDKIKSSRLVLLGK